MITDNRHKFIGDNTNNFGEEEPYKYCQQFINDMSRSSTVCDFYADKRCAQYKNVKLKFGFAFNGHYREQFPKRCDACVANKRPSPSHKVCNNPNCPAGTEPQPIENFHKHSGKRDGHQPRCRACDAKYQKAYRTRKKAMA